MISARNTTTRQSFKIVTCPFKILKTSTPIGEWAANFLPFVESHDGPTNQPTDRPKTNIRGHREVTIPIIKTNVYALVEV